MFPFTILPYDLKVPLSAISIMGSLLGLFAFSVIEGYLLQRSVFIDHTFRAVVLGALGVNLVLKLFWNVFIYPFFMNPLRHLPKAEVYFMTRALKDAKLTETGPLEPCPDYI